MNVAILETGKESQTTAEILENDYTPWLEKIFDKEPLKVVAYVSEKIDSPVIDGKDIMTLKQFATLYHKREIEKVIFPHEVYRNKPNILYRIYELGVEVDDILIAKHLDFENPFAEFIKPYLSVKHLSYLEFHIADHCNLNCKACSHFSGLVKEPHFPKLRSFTRDMERLHEFINDIDTIRILGGEPLLNREINEYIRLSRYLYPKATIYVVTNAILLTKMPESFFETLRECNTKIYISFYPPLEEKMPAIKKFLESKGISFNVSPLFKKFALRITFNPYDRPKENFLHCPNIRCHNLYEGKLAVCSRLFPIKTFNDYYGKNLPEDGALDLYEPNLTTEKLKAHLLKPLELCRYCTPPDWIEWQTIKKPSPITDRIHD